MGKLLVAAIVVALGICGYFQYKHARAEGEVERVAALPPAPPRSLEERAAAAQGTVYPEQRPEPPPRAVEVERGERVSEPANLPAAFHCDGRQYCSQMHSCAEASWFLKNCPTMKMDGDGDGVPCESQWCNLGR